MDSIFLGLNSAADPSSRLFCYIIAGCRLVVDRSLNCLAPFATVVDPALDVPSVPEHDPAQDRGELVYDGEGWVGNATRRVRSWYDGSAHLIHVEGIGAFSVSYDGREIFLLYRDEAGIETAVVEAVLGPVLILALAIGGAFCLHASAVALEGDAVLFLGESGAGKSTLADRLQDSGAGITRLTDDISPIRANADSISLLPDFPQLKLTADEQAAWRDWPVGLDIRAVYVLDRRTGVADEDVPIQSDRLGPAHAFSVLTGQGVASRLFPDDLLRRHARWLARLVELVPVYTLTYPSGDEHIVPIRQFLLDRTT